MRGRRRGLCCGHAVCDQLVDLEHDRRARERQIEQDCRHGFGMIEVIGGDGDAFEFSPGGRHGPAGPNDEVAAERRRPGRRRDGEVEVAVEVAVARPFAG